MELYDYCSLSHQVIYHSSDEIAVGGPESFDNLSMADVALLHDDGYIIIDR